jgi:hypothetical protein
MNHIGDIYFSSLFIKLICRLNKNTDFLYYFINGDVFFENIQNIKRIGTINDNYNGVLINGNPPESLLDNDILQILINERMQTQGFKIIHLYEKDVLFINTWCASEYFRAEDTEFDIMKTMYSYNNIFQKINDEYHLNLYFKLEEPTELINDINYYNTLFLEKYSNICVNDTIFIFNYIPRSITYNINGLNQYIRELSKTNKIILTCYDKIFDNNENIKFIDKDYNILPTPSCSNLIEIWEIAIKCIKIIILPSGCSWTFFHKLYEIKKNHIFILNGGTYLNKLNHTINLLLGENYELIQNV